MKIMAEGVRYLCEGCSKEIESWSDGNPYYIDVAGVKQYAYHPNHEKLAQCIGNDSPHLCLTCGEEFMVDTQAPAMLCPKCGGGEAANTFQLEGLLCPYCKSGIFITDPDFHCIS